MVQEKKAGFILFGGFGCARYPLFLTAIKEHGLSILVIDEKDAAAEKQLQERSQHPDHPFRQMDEIFFALGTDFDGIMSQVSSWRQTYQLKGVYCIKEIFVEVAGLVADFLDVPSPGLRATRVCRNKHLQRLYLKEWSPPFELVPPAKRNEVMENFTAFPVVLKPVGRHSSSGVQLIDSQIMLRESLRHYPQDETLLLEACVFGREFSIETLVQNGQVIFENITQKRTNEAVTHFFVEMAHTMPATNLTTEETQRLLAANRAIIVRLDFQDGITHGEYKITENGQIYIMEIAARNPGDAILLLYHLATGDAMEPDLIKIALGNKVSSYPRLQRYARQIYLDHPKGRLCDVVINGYDHIQPVWFKDTRLRKAPVPGKAHDPASLREIMILKTRDDELGEIKDSFDRAVSALFDASTLEELEAMEQRIQECVTIVTVAHEETKPLQALS